MNVLRPQQIRRFDRIVSVAGAAVLAVVVAGCGSSPTGSTTAASTPTGTASGQMGGPGGGRSGNPGVSGVISAVSGTSLTASDSQGTTSTVKWTSTTRISNDTTGSASDVTTGACVSVRQQMDRQSGGSGMPSGGRPSSGATGSRPSYTVPSAVTASTVTVVPASECTTSTATTSASAESGGRGFGGLTGTVTSVSGSGFVFNTMGSAGKSVTATTSSSTTYVKQITAAASAVQAGKCVEARGTTVNSVLTATSLTISESVNGECTSQMGGFGGGAAPTGAAGNAA